MTYRKWNKMRTGFQNPTNDFRSIPFWAWNDKLEAGELVRQAQEMKSHGMGGFFMHSREGLETEYMGEEWMSCAAAVVEAAKNMGMHAWLYDEDRFPSGGAGGLVCRQGGDPFRAKAVTLEIIQGAPPQDDDVLAVFSAVIEGDKLKQAARIRSKLSMEAEGTFLIFRCLVSGGCEWFNGEAPVDNLNPAAVAAFIDSTYEPYRNRFGEHFGGVIPGIFTDEPSIADFHSVYPEGRTWLPWTDGFAELFREKRGYDIADSLPYLFFYDEPAAKIRHDYWRTIAERFSEAYSRQIGEWCGNNGLAFTGHYLAEHNLGIAIRMNGAVMPHYRYQHIPGIDLLDEKTEEWLTVKQCTSVANQYRREHVLSEMYGCCGWDFTFEGQKRIGDWQFVMGVTLRCQHLSLYSLTGCRKRDFPPNFNDSSPWWKYNQVTEDYFARLSSVLSGGAAVRDILVIHPTTSLWTTIGSDPYRFMEWMDPSLQKANEYEADFIAFMKALLSQHLDFDFGDELIMADDAFIRENQLFVKHAGYRTIVLPMLSNLLDSTLSLLIDFVYAGGTVIAVEPLPLRVNGVRSDKLRLLLEHENFHAVGTTRDCVTALETIRQRRVSLRGPHGFEIPELLYLLKEHKDCHALFVVNHDRTRGCEAEIVLQIDGDVEEWDPLTGSHMRIGVNRKDGSTRFLASFGPAASRLYIVRREAAPMLTEARFAHRLPHEQQMALVTLPTLSGFARTMPNAILLDFCSYRVGEEAPSGQLQVWQAQKNIRERFGMRDSHYNGQTQRYRWADIAHPHDGIPVEWVFSFEVDELTDGDVWIVLDGWRPSHIRLNGDLVAIRPEGWFIDRKWPRIPLPQLKKGRNELSLLGPYRNRDEMENVYVIGDFAVNRDRRILREPEQLSVGDWTLQGYLHYPGNMIYRYDFVYSADWVELTKGCRIVLELGHWEAVTAEVRINGQCAGHIPWRSADGLDVTEYLQPGMNGIEIELAGSLRNLLGPFHQIGTHNPWVDWTFFQREGSRDDPGYFVKPYGLMRPVGLYVRNG
ncbi:glycosyl hydrolase [Paenibacillus contaminans]|nr:glycosyl hydrolase [Paenibacillus contaminans]